MEVRNVGERPVGSGRLAVPPPVVADGPVKAREGHELIVPHAAIEEAVVKQDQRMAFSPDIVVELGSVYPNPAFVLDHDFPPTSRLRAPRHSRVSLRAPQPTFSTG